MWIAVDEATEENGTMSIIPRSHLGPTLEHRRDEGAEQLITCLDAVDIDEAVPCVLEPGGVVFFCYGVVHGTSRNESSLERSGVAYHFVSTHGHDDAETSGGAGEDDAEPRRHRLRAPPPGFLVQDVAVEDGLQTQNTGR